MNEHKDLTERIQQAIEKTVDEDTAALPLIPISEDGAVDESTLDEDMAGEDMAVTAAAAAEQVQIHRWFFTFMCMNIPVVGWIYLLNLAFSRKRIDRREFARAYLFYKLVFLLVSAVILGILIWIGLGMFDQLLAYIEML